MIVKLFDGLEISVSREAGEKLKASMQRSLDGMVTINDIMVKKSAISYIKPGGQRLADVESEQLLREGTAARRVGSSVESIGKLLES